MDKFYHLYHDIQLSCWVRKGAKVKDKIIPTLVGQCQFLPQQIQDNIWNTSQHLHLFPVTECTSVPSTAMT